MGLERHLYLLLLQITVASISIFFNFLFRPLKWSKRSGQLIACSIRFVPSPFPFVINVVIFHCNCYLAPFSFRPEGWNKWEHAILKAGGR